MHDPVLVREGEPARDLVRQRECLRDGQRPLPLDQLLQVLARDVLEDDELPTLVLAAVDDRDDVRVRETRDCLRLATEPLDVLGIVGEVLVQHLERDPPLEARVEGTEDARHAAGAEQVLDLVAIRDAIPNLHGPTIPRAPTRGTRGLM